MATKTQGACLACRARKVKCTPGDPRCARCTAMGIQDCHYTSVKKRGVGNTLRMGQACIPCRQRKNKCDAKQPCTTCVNGDRGAACKYEGSRPSADTPPKPSESPPRGVPLLAWSDSSETGSSQSLSPDLRERSLTPPKRHERQPLSQTHDKTAPVSTLDASADKAPGDPACPPQHPVSSFTILPSIQFQPIPRPFRMSLSVIPPEHLQVSCAAGIDLDMSFRLRSLCRLNKLGVYFTQEKQKAILRGDASNAVVNRHFIDALQVIGPHLGGTPEETPAMIWSQARYAQRALESLIELNKTQREREKVQALALAAHVFIILGLTAGAQLYLLKACEIIEKEKLQFLPKYGSPPKLSDQVREDASVLSQVIYLENYFYLTLGGAVPVKTSRVEKEFRLELKRVYPRLFEMCPLTMRTQSVLLVRDATLALNSLGQAEKANGWQKSCLHLIYALDTFSSDLMRNLQWFTTIGDTSGVGTIWTCCVICLANLTALCHLMSQVDPVSGAFMNSLYDSTLEKLGNVSLETHVEQYSQFDVLTGMSWKTALDTIDARIRFQLYAVNSSLRRWKTVIEDTYAKFQAEFPGFEPDSFASLVMNTDGRSENSKYPNLMVPSERERYGL